MNICYGFEANVDVRRSIMRVALRRQYFNYIH